MKFGVKTVILIPAAAMLICLPLAAYLVFGALSGQYMERLAEAEMLALFSEIEPLANEVFADAQADASMTRRQRVLQDQKAARDFLDRLMLIMRNKAQNAYILILNDQLETVYPRELEDQPDAEGIYRTCADPDRLGQGGAQKVVLEGRAYLTAFRRISDAERTRAKYMIVYSPIHDTQQLLAGTGRMVLAISAGLALLYLAVLAVVSSSISRSLKRLCAYAKRVGKGDFKRLPRSSRLREVSVLQGAMDGMSAQLDLAQQRQKTLYQNISHELRTPLMAISGYVQGIQCGVLTDKDKALATIGAENAKLTELVNGILALSRLDSADQPEKLEPICLAEFLESCLPRLEGLAAGRGIRIRCETEDAKRLFVRGNWALLEQAFNNLAGNCIRHAKSEASIQLRADLEGTRVIIRDDGSGFSEEDLPHLFERFYKGKGGSFGIGLSLAKASLEHMGGAICAYNTETGAAFEMRLDACGEASGAED